MRALIFHILIASFFITGSAFAQTQRSANDPNWCRPDGIPKIDIKTDTDRITWVYNRSQKTLNKADIDTVNPYGNNVITDVGGLMHGGIKMEETMQFGSLTNPNTNEVCMYYGAINVSFHIFPTIYIASEYPPGTCMHNAIKAHELKHINTDRQIVNKYARLVGQAVQNEIRSKPIYGPVPVANQAAIESQVKQRMNRIMTFYSTAMDAERRKLQQQVDNLQEYERVNHLCDPKTKRY